MGFWENIFPLIVIYLIWKVISKAQKAVPTEEAEQQEAGAGQPPLNAADLLRLLLAGRTPPPLPVPAGRQGKEAEGGRPRPARQAGRVLIPAEEGESRARPAKKATAVVATAPAPARPAVRKRLQQAVIWAEILGKPVSLRKE
ncbi:hypothetical protein ACUUL3_08150 [Thiovibrio sp. JS02]